MSDGEAGPSWPRVIVTKVRPPKRRRDLIDRDRLHELITTHMERKLLLVSAPAGYGKTSLLVGYAHATGLPVCWYRLGPSDRDPVVFLEHLMEAVRQRFPGACDRALSQLRSRARDGTADPTDIVGTVVNEIDENIEVFFWLVLDDYQHIDDADRVNEALDALLDYLPHNCQIVISGRTVPRKLTLTRLAGAGQVAGIGQEQLRFDPDEIGRLLHERTGRRPSDAECARLARESEGWVTALVLGGDRLLATGWCAAMDREQLFDFLAHEVVDLQPAEVQSFMVQSAVLEEMDARLCDAALAREDSAAMLAAMETQNLFVSRVEGDDAWHRYHQLFRDFLLSRLQQTLSEPELTAIHRRAADWYDVAGRPDDAIGHYLAAHDHDAAATKMAQYVDAAHRSGRWQTIVRWATSLPEPVLRRRPLLVQRLGTALTYSGDLSRALRVYGWAVEDYADDEDGEGLASVLVRRAVLFRLLGKWQAAIADAQRALELSPEPGTPTAGLAHRALGGALAMKGDTQRAARELQLALACFDALGETALAANAHNDLSAIYQWSGDAECAIDHAHRARAHWERLGNLPALAMTANNLGTAYHLQGRHVEARAWLDRAIEEGDASGYRRAGALARISMGDLLCDAGDLPEAVAAYDDGLALARSVRDATLTCYGLASRADAHRLAGARKEAREDLAKAREAHSSVRSSFEGALVDHVSGTIALDAGEARQATADLSKAAERFGKMGARLEEARSCLYAAAAAQACGDEQAADEWRRRAEIAASGLGHPDRLAVHERRLAGSLRPEEREPEEARSLRDGHVVAESRLEVPPPVTVRAPDVLQVRAFGPPEVLVGNRVLPRRAWKSKSAFEAFFLLAATPGGLTPDQLYVVFWPDASERRARSALHTAVNRMRGALGCTEVIRWDNARYRIEWPGGVTHDVNHFSRLVSRADAAGDDRQRAALLERAVALARGEYMEGVMAEWCVPRRQELEVRLVNTIVALGAALTRVGEHGRAADTFRLALGRDALREDAHRGLMRAYRGAGDRAMALRQFDVCKRILEEELGVPPDPKTVALKRLIEG